MCGCIKKIRDTKYILLQIIEDVNIYRSLEKKYSCLQEYTDSLLVSDIFV